MIQVPSRRKLGGDGKLGRGLFSEGRISKSRLLGQRDKDR